MILKFHLPLEYNAQAGPGRRNCFYNISMKQISPRQNSLFPRTFVFSMKIAEWEQIVVVSCIIGFEDMQVWLRQFSFNLNACACKFMTICWEDVKFPRKLINS